MPVSSGEAVCARISSVKEEVLHGDGVDDVEMELQRYIPAPGSSKESWQLKKLRSLSQAETSPIVSSSSQTNGGARFTTFERDERGYEMETELYWRDNVLVWSRNGVVLRTFSYAERVSRATWAWLDTGRIPKENLANISGAFKDDSVETRSKRRADRALCIFLQSFLIIYFPHYGHEYTKRIDFEILNVLPLHTGLLIQRTAEREDRRRAQGILHRGTQVASLDELDPPSDAPLPTLFYLERPLDELKAVNLVTSMSLQPDPIKEHTFSPVCASDQTNTHFTIIDDYLVFASQFPTSTSWYVVVTANHAFGKIRVYAMLVSQTGIHIDVDNDVQMSLSHRKGSDRHSHVPKRSRQSSGGDLFGPVRPRTSSIRRRVSSVFLPRGEGGPRTSVSTDRSKIPLGPMFGRPSMLQNDDGDTNQGIDEMMQLLDEFDEVDEDQVPVPRQQNSSTIPSTVHRRNSRMSSAPHTSTNSAAPASSMAHVLRTPFVQGSQTIPEDHRSARKSTRFSTGTASQPLDQRDERSRHTATVSRLDLRSSLVDPFQTMGPDKNHTHPPNNGDGKTFVGDQAESDSVAMTLIDEISVASLRSESHSASSYAFFRQTDNKTCIFIALPSLNYLVSREIVEKNMPNGASKLVVNPYQNESMGSATPTYPAHPLQFRPTKQDIVCKDSQTHSHTIILDPLYGTDFACGVEAPDKPRYLSNHLQPHCELTRTALEAFDQLLIPALSAKLRILYLERIRTRNLTDDWGMLCSILETREEPVTPTISKEEPNSFNLLMSSSATNQFLTGRTRFLGNRKPNQPHSHNASPVSSIDLSSKEVAQVLRALHVVAQDARLSAVDCANFLPRMSSLIIALAAQLSWQHWVEYWVVLIPQQTPALSKRSLDLTEPNPFDIYDVLLKKANVPHELLPMPQILKRSSQLVKIFSQFASYDDPHEKVSGTWSDNFETSARHVVESIYQHEMDNLALRKLPFAISAPLFEAMKTCQIDPPRNWSIACYQLIGREDLAASLGSKPRHLSTTETSASLQSSLPGHLPPMPPLRSICTKLFNKDYRLSDVGQMLQTSCSVATRGPQGIQASTEEDLVAEQQKRIFVSATERIKATSIGRGMFLIDTETFSPTERPKIAPLNMHIRMLANCIVQHREPDPESAEMEWPEFHNGTSAALQLSVDNTEVESGWIYSQARNEFNARSSGFIFGLGLRGYLRNLGKVHAHHFLSQRHPMTTIGLLLGISLSFRGSADVMAKALMSIHLIHTLPMYSKPLKTSMLEQSAALMGLGFIFMARNDRWASKMTLKAIGAEHVMTDESQMKKRECYTLSAGFALGLICLGKGQSSNHADELEREVVPALDGMIKKFASGADRGTKNDYVESDDYAAFEWRPDLSLTSTPASIALALMFLRSNRQDIADKLVLPVTISQLDDIRPDILQMRILCRALIMWDNIQPSFSWLTSALPKYLQFHAMKQINSASQSSQLAYWSMRTGAIFAIGLKFAGSNNMIARDCLLQELRVYQSADVRAITYFEKVRQQTLRSSVDLILACLSMIMAGTGDIEILSLLRKALYRVDHTRFGNYMASTMSIGILFLGGGRFTLSTTDASVAAMLIALYPRFPLNALDNRAHLQAYRHFWVLAIEPRLISVEDVDTGKTSTTPIEIHFRQPNADVLHMHTPCLLPRLDSIASIRLASDHHYANVLDIQGNVRQRKSLSQTQTLFAKRLPACLDHERDPSGRASLFAQRSGLDVVFDVPLLIQDKRLTSSYLEQMDYESKTIRELLQSAFDGQDYSFSVRQLLSNPCTVVVSPQEKERYLFRLRCLLHCLTQDKMEAFPILLDIYDGSSQWIHWYRQCHDEKSFPPTTFVRDLRFLIQFAHKRSSVLKAGYASKMLIPLDFLKKTASAMQIAAADRMKTNAAERQRLVSLSRDIMNDPNRSTSDLYTNLSLVVNVSLSTLKHGKTSGVLRELYELFEEVRKCVMKGLGQQRNTALMELALVERDLAFPPELVQIMVHEWMQQSL